MDISSRIMAYMYPIKKNVLLSRTDINGDEVEVWLEVIIKDAAIRLPTGSILEHDGHMFRVVEVY